MLLAKYVARGARMLTREVARINAIESSGLGVTFGATSALQDCTLAIPTGRIVALVGSNGAGKTTLLHCLVGLCRPTAGKIEVLGGIAPGSVLARERIAFVAQDAPLYHHLSARSMISLTGKLNAQFDEQEAVSRLRSLDIPIDRRVGRLSGGQQAQLALTLALARHPELLVLDEPLARLDPVARHDIMESIISLVAKGGLSVVFSSHVVSELEHVADYLILLVNGRVQLADDIHRLLDEHVVISVPSERVDEIAQRFPVVVIQRSSHDTRLLVRVIGPPELQIDVERIEVTLDELVLGYLRNPVADLAGSDVIAESNDSESST